MNKITVVCHEDHKNGYEDYVGVCLLCEIEKLKKQICSCVATREAVAAERAECLELAKSYAHNNTDLHSAIRARGQN